jgi:hypothetical protein
MEPYPKDVLLSGHFEIAKELIEFLTSEQKHSFGSVAGGRELVRV